MDTRRLRRLAQTTATETHDTDTSSHSPFSHQTQTRTPAMTTTHIANAGASNTSAWLGFTYAQFGVAAFMAGVGIWFLPVDILVKGYMMMANVFLVGSAFTLAKTVRDEHEAKRFANRLEEARTEKLLMEVGRGG
jgi:hypothetical protein